MKTVERLPQAAADGMSCVQHQNIRPAFFFRPADNRFALRRIAQVGGKIFGLRAGRRQTGLHFRQFVRTARHQQQPCAGRRQLAGQSLADAETGSGQQDGFPADGRAQAFRVGA